MDSFNKLITKVSCFLDTIGGYALAAVMVLISCNVLLRMTGNPINGTVEWVQYLQAICIGLTISFCGLQGEHITVNLFVDKLPKKARFVIDIFVHVLTLFFVLLTAWVLTGNGLYMREAGQVGMVTRIPNYPFIFVIAFGFLVYAFVAINNIIQAFGKGGD